MSYTITKEQIHQLLPTISSTGEDLLKTWFPDAFELPNGVWYKSPKYGSIVFKTGNKTGYGLRNGDTWTEHLDPLGHIGWTFKSSPEDWQPATEEEEKTALISEAEKKGYMIGNFVSFWFYERGDNKLYMVHKDGSFSKVFDNGKWAEIIKPELPKSVTDWISQLGKDEAIRLINETQGE